VNSSKLSRREMLKTLGFGAASLAVAACVAPAPGAAPAAEGGAAAEEIALSYWGHGYAGREAVVDSAVADFVAENPGAVITLDSIPFGEFETKLATAFAGGTQPDILSVGDWVIPAYVERNLLVPLDPAPWNLQNAEEVFELFEPGTIDGLKHNGNLYGYPMEVSVHAPCYRLDHYAELGLDPAAPPDTFEDWAEVGKQSVIRDEQGRLTRQWFEWYLDNPSYYFEINIGPALLSAGGNFLTDDGTQGALNTDGGLRALQFFSDTIHEWQITNPGFETPEEGGAFVNGLETYAWHNLPGGRWASTTFENMEYGVDWQFQPMFKWSDGVRKNVYYSWGFIVTASSPSPDEAWKFIEFMTRYPDRTIQWVDTAGLVQTRKGWAELDVIKDIPFTPFFLEEFKHSVTMPRTSKYNEIGLELRKQVGRLVASPPDPVEAVAADFDAAVNKILQG